MAVITFDHYRLAVQKQYLVAKTGRHASFLENPSPAQLRNLCILLAGEPLSKHDENVFRDYFGARADEPIKKAIERFGLGRLRSLQDLLLGERSGNLTRVELAAVIVGLEPRPLRKFQRMDLADDEKEIDDSDLKDLTPQKGHGIQNVEVGRKNRLKKGGIILVTLALLGFGGSKFISVGTKDCMQWHIDHYRQVDCSEVQGIMAEGPMTVKKEPLIFEKMRKINVSDTTTFFKDGKPVVWYGKNNKKCEFFSHYGLHPETGKTLKPVTKYIVDKYVIGKDARTPN